MANWKPRTVKDVVQDIEAGTYVLPVIQRRLVWKEEKMELLFDSLLKRNSFGGIMVLQEDLQDKPLFAYRLFSRYGEEHMSASHPTVDRTTFLVIDGQQRLQSFYMGLKGGKDGKTLFFNLFGPRLDYEFQFAPEMSELPESGSNEADEALPKLWYPVGDLFERLRESGGNPLFVSNKILNQHDVSSDNLRNLAQENILQFFMAIFASDTVGISSVTIDRSTRERLEEEKQRVVELFRRLNDGGTRLSTLDLVASMFKGFDYRMEQFFKEVEQFEDIGVSQDEVVKLIFLLQDNHAREITQITKEDTEFAIDNRERIVEALVGTRQFLKYAQLYDYYRTGTRSDIPLYFIAYHLFHKTDVSTSDLSHVYDNYDANNPDFLAAKRWLYLSLLNGVFSRGSGWIPYRTGIRKILQGIKRYKGALFPVQALFNAYENHPLRFSESTTASRLNSWDRDFVFYLIYDHQAIAGRDIDHIHPRSRLEVSQEPTYEPAQIHSIANFQLLDVGTNRHEKRAKNLPEWIESGVADKGGYLKRHLIPDDKELWMTSEFARFLEGRSALIVNKIQATIPEAVIRTDEPEEEQVVEAADGVKITELRQNIPVEFLEHPILNDNTSWFDIFRGYDLGPFWPGRYRNELKRITDIATIADMATAIMVMNLEFWQDSGYGFIYRFHQTPDSGKTLQFAVREFGAYGWKIALDELDKRGFDWRQFLIEPELETSDQDMLFHLEVPQHLGGHSILADEKVWYDIYKSKGLGRMWPGRYRNELKRCQIETVADLAKAIMIMRLEFWKESGYGPIYRFHENPVDGYPLELTVGNFGAWAWKITLEELENRSFNWREFLVE